MNKKMLEILVLGLLICLIFTAGCTVQTENSDTIPANEEQASEKLDEMSVDISGIGSSLDELDETFS